MIGLDPQNARCCRQVCRSGDERSRPTIGSDADILEDVRANQEVEVVGEGIEGAGDSSRTGECVEAVVEIQVGLSDGRGYSGHRAGS